jgi:hypothetical protein
MSVGIHSINDHVSKHIENLTQEKTAQLFSMLIGTFDAFLPKEAFLDAIMDVLSDEDKLELLERLEVEEEE